MKNKQEFIKKMNIADDSFTAISNFYGKMKTNPHQKTKLINSIKKEINKITRIKDVFKNPSCNYATEDKERLLELRDRLDEEDRKLRGFLKKGYLSGEEDEDSQYVDVEDKDFMLYYFQRFEQCKNEFDSELSRLQNSSRRKKNNKNQIKDLQSKILYFEEHQYLLEQLMEHRDMIDEDKLENIKEDMDNFLIEPHDNENREVLTSEYQQMLEDINEDLEEERIEKFKEELEAQNHDQKDQKLAVFDNVNTEENMGELDKDTNQKGKHKNSNADSHKNDKHQKDHGYKKKNSHKHDQHKNEGRNRQESKDNDDSSQEPELKEHVIIKKVSKNKSHGHKNQHQTHSIDEPEKVQKPEPPKAEPIQQQMDLEEALKPTPIITPVTRSSKDLNKRKKSVKKDEAKVIDNNLQVDPQNFPALGQPSSSDGQNNDSKQASPTRERGSRSSSKNKAQSPPKAEPREPQPRLKTMYNQSTPVLSLLDSSYKNMRSEYEQTGEQFYDSNSANQGSKQGSNAPITQKSISSFSDSTLFFIFYYQQDTYNQILAGEELIKRKWEYKSKFQTWFRDNDKGDRSKGDKIYFDFGPDWTTKIVKVTKKI